MSQATTRSAFLRRKPIDAKYSREIEELYAG